MNKKIFFFFNFFPLKWFDDIARGCVKAMIELHMKSNWLKCKKAFTNRGRMFLSFHIKVKMYRIYLLFKVLYSNLNHIKLLKFYFLLKFYLWLKGQWFGRVSIEYSLWKL